MEVAGLSETLLLVYQNKWRRTPKDYILNIHLRDNFDFHYCTVFCLSIFLSEKIYKISGIYTIKLVYCDLCNAVKFVFMYWKQTSSCKAHNAKAVLRSQSRTVFLISSNIENIKLFRM